MNSMPTKNGDAGSGVISPTTSDMTELIRVMLEQNRLREQQMDQIVNRLFERNRVDSSPPTSVPNHTQIIPTFNGESGDTDVASEWINALKSVALLNRWPDACTLEAGRSHLEGAARSWFLSHMTELNTLEQFITSFEQTFTCQESITEMWKKMNERVELRGETVFAYFHDKVRMCRRLSLSPAETKKMICIGLLSREMCASLLSNSHTSEVDLLSDIRMYTEVYTNRSERFRPASRPEKRHAVSTTITTVKTGSNEQVSTNQVKRENIPRTSTSSGPRCYNCQLSGHIARDCTSPRKPLKCIKCNTDGHTAKYCRIKQPVDVGCISTPKSTLIKEGVMQYIKKVRINDYNEPVNGLIDTGSAYCIIKRSVAQKYNLVISPKTVNMYVYGNAQHVTSYGETEAVIRIDDVAERITLLVVDDHVQGHDVIVGRTFTDCDDVSFVKTQGELKFTYGMIFPYDGYEVPKDPSMNSEPRVVIKSDNETIPASSVKIVEVQINNEDRNVLVINENQEEDISLPAGRVIGKMRDSNDTVEETSKQVTEITANMVNYDPSTTPEEIGRLLNLLNQYRTSFAFGLSELGCTDLIQMDIIDNNQPVVSRPYRTTIDERTKIDQIVQEWKDAGLVTETKSSYASPVLLVSKRDGDARLVVDYRKLNAQTVRKIYPTPNLDEHLEALYGAKLFTTLDLASGYLQVPLSERAKEKTAFITPNETGQFERMVFGLVNAPYEFSRLMQRVMQPLRNKVAMWYLDDILIPAISFEDMLGRLQKVFEALRKANLTLKMSKCHFGFKQVTYLGFILSANGLEPGAQKVSAIQQIEPPKDRHEVRRFLGLTGFFRRFIPKYAQIAAPISELLKKSVSFSWEHKQEEAFQTLKKKLTESPILQIFNPASETELHCDASSLGLSGMLLQRGIDGRLHLVHAVSKKATAVEKNYHSSKMELMAVVWSITRLRPYLVGMKFTVVTDCQALVHLNAKKTSNPQIARWATLLSEYDFEVRHRPGDKMTHVDALSRAPIEQATDTEKELIGKEMGVMLTMTEDEYVITMQRSDQRLREIIDALSKTNESVDQKLCDYELRNGILYRRVQVKGELRSLWMVPNAMRKAIVIKFHDQMGHFAVDRTVDKILEQYYFPSMRRYVKYHINCCPECILTKVPRGTQRWRLQPIKPGRRPFDVVNIDHLGPYIKSTQGNAYIIVIIDNLTKYVKLYAVKNTSTHSLLKVMKIFVLMFGIPRRVITDRGTAYTSRQFEMYCTEQGIKHSLISVRHPQSNGQVERVNGTLVPLLQVSAETEVTWDKKIAEMECQLNNAVNKTIGDTPFHVLYGYYPSITDGVLSHVVTEQRYEDVNSLQQQIRQRILAEHKLWTEKHASSHGKPVQYTVGEVVFLKRGTTSTGDSTKLQPRYRGPLVITEVLPHDAYRVVAIRNQDNRQYATTAHVTNLKGYHLIDEMEDQQFSETEEKDEIEDRRFSITGEVDEEESTVQNEPEEEDLIIQPEGRPVRERKRPAYLTDYCN